MTIDQATGRGASAADAELALALDAYLADLEAGRPADPERLVADHSAVADRLRACLAGLRLFERSGAALAAQPMDDAPPDPDRRLGDFRIVREVGRGGMGVVYEAEQISLRRRVALKVLPWAAAMDAKQLQRFKNEALAAASLKHPHIVSVYAVGCERGVHFYAMEFVEGRTLAQLIANLRPKEAAAATSAAATLPYKPGTGAPPTRPVAALSTEKGGPRDRSFHRRAAELIAQAADALEHAHGLGIVHRDVKPGNLLLDETGKLYVGDFGLARFGPDAGLTMSGDLLGTLRYMSPEQALARHGLLDHRTDVYSLGATLYELLALRPAVGGEDKHELLRQIAFEEPTPLCKLDRAIPTELETITLTALAKSPAERYATAGEFAADLRRWLDDRTIKAMPPTVRQRVAKWARRHRAAVWAGAFIVAATGAALAGSVGWVAADSAARKARTEDRLRGALDRAEARLVDGNPHAPELLAAVRQADAELERGLAGETLRRRAERVHADLAMLADVELARMQVAGVIDGNLTRAAVAEYAKAFRRYGTDVEAAGAATVAGLRGRAIAPHLGAALDDWAGRLLTDKRADEAGHLLAVASAVDPDAWRNRLRCVLTSRDRATTSELSELARQAPVDELPAATLNLLGGRLSDAGLTAAAAELMLKAHRRFPADFWINHNLGTVLGRVRPHRMEEGVGFIRAAIALRPDSPSARIHLAYTLERLGRHAEAVAECREALRLEPDFVRAYVNLGIAQAGQGKIDEAVASFREAIRRQPDMAKAHYNLGVALAQKGQTAEAIASYKAALGHDPDYAHAHHGLGNALLKQGRVVDAIASYQDAVRRRPDFAEAHSALGEALAAQGDREAAVACYREAIRLEPDRAKAHLNLGAELWKQGQKTEAAAAWRNAVRIKPDFAEAHVNLAASQAGQSEWAEAVASLREAVRLKPDWAVPRNGLARQLANCPDTALRDPRRAVEHARKAVDREPERAGYWNTLGLAHYRNGEWAAAAESLTKAVQLRKGDDAADFILLSMTHKRLANEKTALDWYDKAVERMDEDNPKDEQLRRFRAEAAELLGVPAKPDP